MPATKPTFRPAIRYKDPKTGKIVTKEAEQWYDVHSVLFDNIPDKKLKESLIRQDAEYFKFTGRGNKPPSPAGFVDERGTFYSREQAQEIAEFFGGMK